MVFQASMYFSMQDERQVCSLDESEVEGLGMQVAKQFLKEENRDGVSFKAFCEGGGSARREAWVGFCAPASVTWSTSCQCDGNLLVDLGY